MKISPFQMYESKDWAGLTTKNHLGYLWGIEPQKISKVLTFIHQVNTGASLGAYLQQFPKIYLETDDDFTWDLMGNGEKNIPLAKAALTPTGAQVTDASRAGINHTEFYLWFDEGLFTDVNIIVGEQNEKYPIRILEDPMPDGGLYRYKVELFTGDPDLFVPAAELAPGKRFSKEWSPVEDTLSKKGGGVHYTSPFRMKNTFSMIRMEDTVPGNMRRRPVRFSWKHDKTGKPVTTWMDYRTYEFEKQFQDEKNRLLKYATTNRTDSGTYMQKGKSGYQIKQGAGIKQQMEASNYYAFSTFNIKKLTEMLMDLTVGKVPQQYRKVVLHTGEWGMYDFSEALERHSTLYTPVRNYDRIYKKQGNAYGFRGQFLEFIGPNGIEVTLMHDPYKDDIVRNKLRIPGQPGLAESRVFDIYGLGSGDGGPNIQLVYQTGEEDIRGFIPGFRHPFDLNSTNSIMSTPVDGWTEHRGFVGGVQVNDPTKTATYKPNILA